MAKMTIELTLPKLPNFLHIAGSEDEALMDVSNVPVETLRELGEEWTEELIEHAKARRAEQAEQAEGAQSAVEEKTL